jgi:hypothetical protein
MYIHTTTYFTYHSLAFINMSISLLGERKEADFQINRRKNSLSSNSLSSNSLSSNSLSSNSLSSNSLSSNSLSSNSLSPRPHSFSISLPIANPQINQSKSFSEELGKKEGGTSHYWIGEMKKIKGKFKRVKSCNGRKPGFICEACLRGMPARTVKTQNSELSAWIAECLKYPPYEGLSPVYTVEHNSSMIQTGKFMPTISLSRSLSEQKGDWGDILL